MTACLHYRSSTRVWIPDEYRWIDSARFEIGGTDGATSATDVLSALLRDRHYVDAYQYAASVASAVETSGNWRSPDSPDAEHGPYYLSFISVDTFDVLDGPAAYEVLTEWVATGRSVFPTTARRIEGDLPAIMQTLRNAPVVYRLQDLGDGAWQPGGGALWEPYEEFVAVDLNRRQLHLVAAGGD